MPGVRTAIVATSAVLLFGGMVNVAELLLARKLGADASGYSLFVAVSGSAIAAGSLMGASGGELRELHPALPRRHRRWPLPGCSAPPPRRRS